MPHALPMSMRTWIAVFIGLLVGVGAMAAWADDVTMKRSVPGPEPRVITPGLLYDRAPGDETRYPGGAPRVPYDPAFIRPFVRELQTPTSTGRIGVSGWTSPNTQALPSGTGAREISGWLGFGFTWTWGGPPPPRRPRG